MQRHSSRPPLSNLLLIFGLMCHRTISFQLPHISTHHHHRMNANTILRSSSRSLSEGDGDPVLRLPLMEAELDSIMTTTMTTTESDDTDDLVHRLREEIGNAKTAAEFGVRRAQVDFYGAFSAQDVERMRAVWSDDGEDVRCVHPGSAGIHGKAAIMESWEQIFQQGEPFDVDPDRVTIEICGKTALCSCLENTPNGGKLEALNVYRREHGRWRMTLHLASPIFATMIR